MTARPPSPAPTDPRTRGHVGTPSGGPGRRSPGDAADLPGESVPGSGSAATDPGTSPSFTPPPFHPPWWARGPHAQTLLGKVLRPRKADGLRRERWPTPDGDFLDLDFTADPDPASPLVLVLHGLEGSSRRGYVLVALEALRRRGLAGVALNFRGCSGEPNRVPRAYHSGETGDPGFVLEELRRRFPHRPMGSLGFSLGGNVLLALLGEWGEGARGRIDAAAAVSVPYDLQAGARLLERTGWGRIYARYFLRSLRRKVREKAHLLRKDVSVERALASRTIRAFDDALTAPLHGFRDAADYYVRCSSAGWLSSIRVPTLLLHARDDPLQPLRTGPPPEVRTNPLLTASVPDRGGHVGFVHGPPWAPRFWAEDAAAGFLAAALAG